MLSAESLMSSTYYASDGAAYEYWLGRWARRLAERFLDFAAFPHEGDMLDVGCGTGALAFAMAERWPGRGVIGIDIAPRFVEYARARRPGETPILEVADACALPYRTGQFIGAAAQLVLMFIPRPELALYEMKRVVRSGGTVAAALWDFRGGLIFQRMLWDTASAIDPGAATTRDQIFANPLVLPEGLLDLFRNAGLSNVERGSLTIRMDFADFEDYWQPFQGGQGPVGRYFAELAPDLKGRIKHAVRDAYCSGAPDGARSLTATAWAVKGTVP
jgi:SAM-dependent methyltransferase